MALVRNRRWDYLATNALGRAVYAEIFDGRTGPPNHVRYVFSTTAPGLLRRLADRRSRHGSYPSLRNGTRPAPHRPRSAHRGAAADQRRVRAIWSQHDVRLPAAGLHRFHHPVVGDLDLDFEAAELRPDPGLTLLLATAEQGSPTETALHGSRRRRPASNDGTAVGSGSAVGRPVEGSSSCHALSPLSRKLKEAARNRAVTATTASDEERERLLQVQLAGRRLNP